jgi:hypothetical protein
MTLWEYKLRNKEGGRKFPFVRVMKGITVDGKWVRAADVLDCFL